jgi:hypothetical protein
MLLRITFVGMVVLLLSSCQESNCHRSQQNPILGKNEYNSAAYQLELYRLIKESPEVDYYFEMREEFFGQNYIVVSAYGDAFCGKLCLLIAADEMERIKLSSNKEASGAQLIGLRYAKKETDYGATLVYQDLEYVVY